MIAIVIVVLIGINAVYVAAEFAAVAVPRSRVRQAAESGQRLAQVLLPVVDDARALDRYIACSQIGITASSLVLGAFGQATLAVALRPVLADALALEPLAAISTAAVVVLVGLTVLQMVVGELVPKSLALQFPTQVALATVLPMRWSQRMFSWFIVVLNGSGNQLLRWAGVSEGGHRHVHSADEIEYVIAESRAGGVLGSESSRRLRRALHLGSRTVRQIMVPRTRMDALNGDLPFGDLVARAAESPHTRLPVYRGTIEDMVGYVHSRDLLLERQRAEGNLAHVLRPLVLVPDSLSVDRLLSRLREQHAQIAVVTDEFGGVAGLVTIGDVLTDVMGALPNEFATEGSAERLPDGRLRVVALTRVGECEPWLIAAWPGRAGTVGGRLVERLGRVPAAGEHLVVDGIALDIETATPRAVRSILVTPPRKSTA